MVNFGWVLNKNPELSQFSARFSLKEPAGINQTDNQADAHLDYWDNNDQRLSVCPLHSYYTTLQRNKFLAVFGYSTKDLLP